MGGNFFDLWQKIFGRIVKVVSQFLYIGEYFVDENQFLKYFSSLKFSGFQRNFLGPLVEG